MRDLTCDMSSTIRCSPGRISLNKKAINGNKANHSGIQTHKLSKTVGLAVISLESG